MKKISFFGIIAVLAISTSVSQSQQVATNVSMWAYPCSLPNSDNSSSFPIARDNLLQGLCMGQGISTGSRVGNPTGIEIKSVFDASDICVSTTTYLWRAIFNPPSPYTSEYGQRGYCPVVIVGCGGQIALNSLQYRVTCGVGLLANQSSLAGQPYSISRRGILAGPDGKLFTPDDVQVTSGAGTNLVDAIVFIGSRVGADVERSSDITNLDDLIGPNGTWISYQYMYTPPTSSRTITFETTVPLYKAGGIPVSQNGLKLFLGPTGAIFSFVAPAGTTPMNMIFARKVAGQWISKNASAAEGSSMFAPFTGIPGEDAGFGILVQNQ